MTVYFFIGWSRLKIKKILFKIKKNMIEGLNSTILTPSVEDISKLITLEFLERERERVSLLIIKQRRERMDN